ncbi:hypothetical protein VTJ04DRAFT_10080 [Mycothermus thermophilus]|uniref:uncharacterized protein n=1 Tax=Humicola insolens TaxID=85995 RepID=UPI003742A981
MIERPEPGLRRQPPETSFLRIQYPDVGANNIRSPATAPVECCDGDVLCMTPSHPQLLTGCEAVNVGGLSQTVSPCSSKEEQVDRRLLKAREGGKDRLLERWFSTFSVVTFTSQRRSLLCKFRAGDGIIYLVVRGGQSNSRGSLTPQRPFTSLVSLTIGCFRRLFAGHWSSTPSQR